MFSVLHIWLVISNLQVCREVLEDQFHIESKSGKNRNTAVDQWFRVLYQNVGDLVFLISVSDILRKKEIGLRKYTPLINIVLCLLILSFPIFPFDHHENVRKPSRGIRKKRLERKSQMQCHILCFGLCSHNELNISCIS